MSSDEKLQVYRSDRWRALRRGHSVGDLEPCCVEGLLNAESPFLAIAANPARLHLGAFFVLVMGLSLAAMPLFLYPLFRRKNEALAIGVVVFIGGAVFLYSLFYQTRLIPRWLSLWGLIAAVPYLAVDLLKFFGHDAGLDLLYAPLAVQEMVMAVRLIIRGFDGAGLNAITTDRVPQRAPQ